MITIHHDWRVIYQVSSALIGFVLLLAFFTFPETAYSREPATHPSSTATQSAGAAKTGAEAETASAEQPSVASQQRKPSYLSSLKLFQKTLTHEGLLTLFVRPLGLILLPPILWAALVQAVTIGYA